MEIQYRVEPLADLYQWARQGSDGDDPFPEAWAPAAASIGEVTAEFRSFFDALRVDGFVAERTTTAEVLRDAGGLPEHVGPGAFAFRDAVIRVGRALATIEDDYLGSCGARLRVLNELRCWLARELGPSVADCLAFIGDSLGIAVAEDFAAPVWLVSSAPWPGAFTARSPRHGACCFVAQSAAAGTQLYEIILHEATHALEEAATGEERSLTARLQTEQRERGIAVGDPRAQLWHALYFFTAAEAVRRFVDPGHVDYGDSHGYYERLSAHGGHAREIWRQHLAGELETETAYRQLVALLDQ